MTSPGLLSGLKILSFCHYLQGPAAVQYLADLGATVVKIEPLHGAAERRAMGSGPGPDGAGPVFLSGNRNVSSVAVDLKTDEGRDLIHTLVAEYDIVVENYKLGVLDRLGIGYEALRAHQPKLIYASASGFGDSGPLAHSPGQDLLAQAMSGLMWASGSGDRGPRATSAAVIDQHGAALLAMGILAAVHRRTREGIGCRVSSNLLSAAVDLQQEALVMYMNGGGTRSAENIGRRPESLASWYHPGVYGTYRTADDQWVAISLTSREQLNAAFRAVANREISEADWDHQDTAVHRTAELVSTVALDALSQAFSDNGIWFTEILSYDQLIRHPQVEINGSIREIDAPYGRIRLVAHPLTYDNQAVAIDKHPPAVGEDSLNVLRSAGFSDTEITELDRRNVIAIAGTSAEPDVGVAPAAVR